MKCLYEQKLSHMDLKPENILLTSVEHPVLKLAGKNTGIDFKVVIE